MRINHSLCMLKLLVKGEANVEMKIIHKRVIDSWMNDADCGAFWVN